MTKKIFFFSISCELGKWKLKKTEDSPKSREFFFSNSFFKVKRESRNKTKVLTGGLVEMRDEQELYLIHTWMQALKKPSPRLSANSFYSVSTIDNPKKIILEKRFGFAVEKIIVVIVDLWIHRFHYVDGVFYQMKCD